MTALLNEIRNKLLFVCALCFAVIGALLFAPSAYADSTYLNEYENICEYYSLDPDEYFFLASTRWQTDNNYDVVFAFPRSSVTRFVDCRLGSYGNGVNNGAQFTIDGGSSYPVYIYNEFNDSYSLDNTSSTGIWFNGVLGSANNWVLPYNWYGSVPSEDIENYFRIPNGFTFDYCVSYNQISEPIETTSETYADVLLQSYLHDNHINVDNATAWIILYSGEPVQIPISYTTPTNYSGDFYVRQTSYTPYLDEFSVVVNNPDFVLSRYQGSKLCIKYPFNCTTLKLYGLYKEQPIDGNPTIAFDPTLPQGSNYVFNQLNGVPSFYSFDGSSYLGRCLEMSDTSNVDYPVFISWDMWYNTLSAIPRTNSLLVGIDITITDTNGNDTIGRDTTNYNTFVTNYNQKSKKRVHH